jgi:hypothetical protein
MVDGKTMIDSKEAIGEGPASPGEGPPPSLPPPPTFNLIPTIVPQIPPVPPPVINPNSL